MSRNKCVCMYIHVCAGVFCEDTRGVFGCPRASLYFAKAFLFFHAAAAVFDVCNRSQWQPVGLQKTN